LVWGSRRAAGGSKEMTPIHPIDIAESLNVPVLGLYGEADEGIPTDTVERMRIALENGASGSRIVSYTDAPHGFHADYRSTYRKEHAEDAWNRLVEWLKKHGVA